MNLSSYLERNQITQTQFAEQIGVTQGYISQLLSGRVKCSPDVALKIELITKKTVTRHEMLWPKERRSK